MRVLTSIMAQRLHRSRQVRHDDHDPCPRWEDCRECGKQKSPDGTIAFRGKEKT